MSLYKFEASFHDLQDVLRAKLGKMPSDIIIASVIIAGSILYATRNRSMQIDGTAYLGRKEDLLTRKLDEINRSLKQIKKN